MELVWWFLSHACRSVEQSPVSYWFDLSRLSTFPIHPHPTHLNIHIPHIRPSNTNTHTSHTRHKYLKYTTNHQSYIIPPLLHPSSHTSFHSYIPPLYQQNYPKGPPFHPQYLKILISLYQFLMPPPPPCSINFVAANILSPPPHPYQLCSSFYHPHYPLSHSMGHPQFCPSQFIHITHLHPEFFSKRF